MMELLLPYGNIEGFDFSAEALRFCARRGLADVSQQDITTWHGGANVYDIIISLDVLCHESIADDNAIIRMFHQALKPGGMLIVNLPAFNCSGAATTGRCIRENGSLKRDGRRVQGRGF